MRGDATVTVWPDPFANELVQVTPPPDIATWQGPPTYWSWVGAGAYYSLLWEQSGTTPRTQVSFRSPYSLLPGIPVNTPVTVHVTFRLWVDVVPTWVNLQAESSGNAAPKSVQADLSKLAPGWNSLDLTVPKLTPYDAATTIDDVATSLSITSPAIPPTGSIRIADYTVAVQSTISTPIDLTCLIDSVSIQHGRDDWTSQPNPASATVEISTDGEPFPTGFDVGATITVDVELADGTSSRRFAGRLSDIVLSWDDAGAATPTARVAQLVAVSGLADIERRIIGDQPFPQELDGARVARVFQLVNIAAAVDPGSVELVSVDIDSQPALQVAREAAESARGLVWHTRAGLISYADVNHRSARTPALELDACDLLAAPSWRRTTEGLINYVSVGYGVAPDGGEQPRLIKSDTESIAEFGRYGYSVSTQLAAVADAQIVVTVLLRTNADPAWVLGAAPVAVADLSDAEHAALMSLELGSLIGIENLPTNGAAPTTAALWVEGWTERLEAELHELELVVSDYVRTAAPSLWDQTPPDVTWDTVDPLMTWDTATFPPDWS